MPASLERPWTPAEVAAFLSVKTDTLKHWRARNFGPKWYKLGGGPKAHVRYHPGSVRKFVKEFRHLVRGCLWGARAVLKAAGVPRTNRLLPPPRPHNRTKLPQNWGKLVHRQ